MEIGPVRFEPGDLLLVVDVQNDFCPGGALPIEGGDGVVPVLNDWIRAARDAGIGLYFSRDWHPKNHISFEENGGSWPPHCVQDSEGARFHPDLVVPDEAVIVTKGTRFDQDQNSAFDQTGLAEWLHKQDIKRIFVGGLAQDVCVQATVIDGQREGFEMHLLQSATRPVTAEGGRESLEKMQQAGAVVIQ
ncbi:MAG TPA: nicotinamidase [Geoalkalibacter subterraneus]|uniref:nicotinamidase n=1 Tax=Geoalkalibacter subterraneus TaxID=483547 RepID=A0A831L7E3_9BACT|nr:nicotinamidase [Geoalkalibacter subterraneus]